MNETETMKEYNLKNITLYRFQRNEIFIEHKINQP